MGCNLSIDDAKTRKNATNQRQLGRGSSGAISQNQLREHNNRRRSLAEQQGAKVQRWLSNQGGNRNNAATSITAPSNAASSFSWANPLHGPPDSTVTSSRVQAGHFPPPPKYDESAMTTVATTTGAAIIATSTSPDVQQPLPRQRRNSQQRQILNVLNTPLVEEFKNLTIYIVSADIRPVVKILGQQLWSSSTSSSYFAATSGRRSSLQPSNTQVQDVLSTVDAEWSILLQQTTHPDFGTIAFPSVSPVMTLSSDRRVQLQAEELVKARDYLKSAKLYLTSNCEGEPVLSSEKFCEVVARGLAEGNHVIRHSDGTAVLNLFLSRNHRFGKLALLVNGKSTDTCGAVKTVDFDSFRTGDLKRDILRATSNRVPHEQQNLRSQWIDLPAIPTALSWNVIATHDGPLSQLIAPRGLEKTVTIGIPVKAFNHHDQLKSGSSDLLFSVKTLNGDLLTLSVSPHAATGMDLMREIAAEEGLSIDMQRLIYRGKQLLPSDPLLECAPQALIRRRGGEGEDGSSNCTSIHLVLRLRGGMYVASSGRSDFRVELPQPSLSSEIRRFYHGNPIDRWLRPSLALRLPAAGRSDTTSTQLPHQPSLLPTTPSSSPAVSQHLTDKAVRAKLRYQHVVF